MNRVLIFLFFVATGCGDVAVSTHQHDLSEEGPWQPPAELVERSISYDIPYVGAGPWVGPEGCGGSFLDGTRDLQNWLETYWPQIVLIGGYSCRAIAGSSNMSVHATGRALDIHIPLHDGDADNDLGDPLANYLIEHAEAFGIQLIIWDRWIWSTGRSGASRSRAYTGQHPHHDHLHIELTPEAAERGYPWWDTEMDPPDLGACAPPLSIDGGAVDNEDACFTAYGPPEFWRTEAEGFEGSLRWTNAWETDEASNWARWNFEVSKSGKYRIEYYSTPEWALFGSTRYSVRHAGGDEEIILDQGAGASGWNALGTFEFAAADHYWVDVYDLSDGPVDSDQHIVADAVRLVRIDNPGMTMEEEREERENQDPPDVTEPEVDDTPSNEAGCASSGTRDSSWLVLIVFGLASMLRRRTRVGHTSA